MPAERNEIPGVTKWYRQPEFFMQWKNSAMVMPTAKDMKIQNLTGTSEAYPSFFHNHDHYEIYFLLAGEATFYVEEFGYALQPGDMVIVPPERMHRVFANENNAKFERMFFYLTRASAMSMSTDAFPFGRIIEHAMNTNQFLYHFSPEECATYYQGMLEITDAEDFSTPAGELIARCRFIIMMTNLCKVISNSTAAQQQYTSPLVSKAIAYINAHYTEPITLSSVAQELYISKYHLSREFKDYTYITVRRYILAKRIMLAKKLMQEGIPSTEACHQCGFQDYSSFFRIFQKETGMSPKQFLAQLNDNLC